MKNSQQGFMQIIAGLVVGLLVIGGIYYFMASDTSNNDSDISNDTATSSSELTRDGQGAGGDEVKTLRSLLNIGRDVSCGFNNTTGEIKTEGEIFISAGGNMKGDFKSVLEDGREIESEVLITDDTVYAWSGNEGTKFENLDSEGNFPQEEAIGLDTKVDYDCEDWRVDRGKFTVPADVNFIDLSELLDGGFLENDRVREMMGN